MSEENYLLLSNDLAFYTLEGEGRYIGYPSVFLRLFGCNLTCKGFISQDSPYGCDSYISWSVKNKMTFDEIFTFFEREGFHERLKSGAILKITGGEPLLRQEQLLNFIKAFALRYEFVPLIDFETNGTVMPDQQWVTLFNATFTTSPKLSNNGDPEDRRYKPDVLRYLANNNACFKFVVKNESDVQEVIEKYCNTSGINVPRSLVWLMPCCGSRAEQNTVAEQIAEICKKYNFKLSPRLHLMIWDKALKV